MCPKIVIPARLESSRLPEKLLLDLGGKSVLQRVWERAQKARLAAEVVIATDSVRIREAAMAWGARVQMTPPDCPNGTARIASVLAAIGADFVVNLQGDEPFIAPELLDELIRSWQADPCDVVTAVRPIDSVDELVDPSVVKVALGRDGRAWYFSRSAIPHQRGLVISDWLGKQPYWAHIGVYGYSRETLEQYNTLEAGILEGTECLEQLRFLENGRPIRAVITPYHAFGIDTLQDLERARRYASEHSR